MPGALDLETQTGDIVSPPPGPVAPVAYLCTRILHRLINYGTPNYNLSLLQLPSANIESSGTSGTLLIKPP